LEAIQEHMPVYAGKFRIVQDVAINFSPAADGVRSLISSEKKVTINGELTYQAFDKTICYPPDSVPVMWSLRVLKRSPEAIRHK
jgi:hypothetical protein